MTAGLGHTADLSHRATFPLLGIPVEIRSNSLAVIAAAEDTLGTWRHLPASLVAQVPPRVVSVIVQPSDREPAVSPQPFTYRAHEGTLLASDGENLLTAQYDRGRAIGLITPAMLERGPDLRHNVIQMLALLLATQHDRVPLHAGAVVLDGLAIVLAGPSMAGKSTLAYACLRNGFELLAEDVVYVSREPRLRLWGQPDRLHLLPDAVRFFPELADLAPAVHPTGKFKLALETQAFAPDRAVRHAGRAVLCVVARHDRAESRIEPIERAVAIAALSANREPGFDLYAGAEEVAEALTAKGSYRLLVGSDPLEMPRQLRVLAKERLGATIRQ